MLMSDDVFDKLALPEWRALLDSVSGLGHVAAEEETEGTTHAALAEAFHDLKMALLDLHHAAMVKVERYAPADMVHRGHMDYFLKRYVPDYTRWDYATTYAALNDAQKVLSGAFWLLLANTARTNYNPMHDARAQRLADLTQRFNTAWRAAVSAGSPSTPPAFLPAAFNLHRFAEQLVPAVERFAWDRASAGARISYRQSLGHSVPMDGVAEVLQLTDDATEPDVSAPGLAAPAVGRPARPRVALPAAVGRRLRRRVRRRLPGARTPGPHGALGPRPGLPHGLHHRRHCHHGCRRRHHGRRLPPP